MTTFCDDYEIVLKAKNNVILKWIRPLSLIAWLNPRAGKMKCILHSDWLPEGASHLGFPVLVLQEKVCFLAMILNWPIISLFSHGWILASFFFAFFHGNCIFEEKLKTMLVQILEENKEFSRKAYCMHRICAFIKYYRENWLQLMDMTLTLQDSGEHDTKPYNSNKSFFSKNIKVFLFWIFLILFPSASKYAIP